MPAHSESPLDACFASVATFVHDKGEPETSATGISPQCAAPVTTLISHRPRSTIIRMLTSNERQV